MRNPWIVFAALLAIAGGAFCFRWSRIAIRPMHGDEAINTFKLNELRTTGRFAYDPLEYHGPTLYYLSQPLARLTGKSYRQTTEASHRALPLLFSIGLILLTGLLWRGLGPMATILAAILAALSPAMSFYSIYYIHEIPLLFFTFGAIVAGWRYLQTRHMPWLYLAGAAIGLMHATKETWVISAVAAGGAIVVTLFLRRLLTGEKSPSIPWKHAAGAVTVGLVVTCLFYSGFFSHARGPLDSILAYRSYLARGTGGGEHDHPWNYYLKLLTWNKYGRGPIWSEGLILFLCLIGIVRAFWNARRIDRFNALHVFLALYTLAGALGYSLIRYKTPWCLLTFLHGMILLAGIGAAGLIACARWRPVKIGVGLLLIAAGIQLAIQMDRTLGPRYAADRQNPYTYSQPGATVLEIPERINALAAVSPSGPLMRIKAFTRDIWPVPWYLRTFANTGYWESPTDNPDAEVILASPEQRDIIEARLKDKYQPMFFGLRPGVVLTAYVREDLWKRFLEQQRAAPAR
jgi:uncharacterized protein (TIGR03663 family)